MTLVVTQPHPPINMILHCPKCGMQHIDAPEVNAEWCDGCTPDNCMGGCGLSGKWTNPPHRSHLCAGCGHIWRPADVPTNGIAAIRSRGVRDSVPVDPAAAKVPPDVIDAAKQFKANGYRGPLMLASKVFDWVAAQETDV